MNVEHIVGAVVAAGGFVWANREHVIKWAALAVAHSEKEFREYLEDGTLDADEENTVLQAAAVKYLQRVRWLKWLPEGLLVLAIREACRRRR